MTITARVLLTAALLAPLAADSALAQSAPVKHTVNADGQPLALWEKRAAKPKGVIVLLHGRTWSSLPDDGIQDTSVSGARAHHGSDS